MLIHEQQAAGAWARAARTTLFGRPIEISARVLPAIERANEYFASDRLTDADRAGVEASIASLRGAGRAIALSHNARVSRAAAPHARRMALFDHVVRREPAFNTFDAWTEVDSLRWLEANRLFNFHFPLFLSELLDEARGGASNTVLAEWAEAFDWIAGTTTLVGRAMVCDLGASDLATAAAMNACRPETAEWLHRLVADWHHIRAWIEGNGMILVHPKLVEALEAGGWTWCVDRPGTKEFTRFEA